MPLLVCFLGFNNKAKREHTSLSERGCNQGCVLCDSQDDVRAPFKKEIEEEPKEVQSVF